jgi:hypothetical protein
MGNLDFTNHAGFSWYCLFLLISGIAMLCMTGIPTQGKGTRIANLVFGIGFVCYAIYLIEIFDGGTYFIFFKAFILPVFLVIGTIKSAADGRRAKKAGPYVPPVMNYAPGQPVPPQSPWAAAVPQQVGAPVPAAAAAAPVAPFTEQPTMPLQAEPPQN